MTRARHDIRLGYCLAWTKSPFWLSLTIQDKFYPCEQSVFYCTLRDSRNCVMGLDWLDIWVYKVRGFLMFTFKLTFPIQKPNFSPKSKFPFSEVKKTFAVNNLSCLSRLFPTLSRCVPNISNPQNNMGPKNLKPPTKQIKTKNTRD